MAAGSAIGPSGSAKSTLLSCISRPERQIARMRQRVGKVLQQFSLLLAMTALQNIMEAPVRAKRTSTAKAPPGGRGRAGLVDAGQMVERRPPRSVLSAPQQPRTLDVLPRVP